ncbi:MULTISPECIES: PH domain-containing protein [unclassified Gordonia (in: high G+C Gram-positive bacteria)]|uniref:PH domain-containing protein n=1 Tax=unclassified Gordonia (in: high G+C Gram-positive bacteria) TaxID=2657482 RepID=UPI001F0D7E7B|nr:PH domain-containing protein [Gordonia sp. ABSL49_1]MCH5644450.1 PH domain-containing protein [Gordonia sp. ABSL49_1]
MDNSVDASWATPRAAAAALCIAGFVLLAVALVAAPDAVGLLMISVAGVLLLAFGGYALIIRPRLAVAASPPQLTIRTIGGVHTYAPDQVERIRLLALRRIGRRTAQLEIDLLPDGAGSRDDARLVVFSRWDLGADLITVVDELRRAGFTVDDARP